MNKIKNITIIGSGNVGSHLAIALFDSGFNIKQIYSRSIENAITLSKSTHAKPIDNLDNLEHEIDLIVIAVKDDIIPQLIKQIPFKNILTVHTSGSLQMDVFKTQGFENYGIFYPLQSFNKNKEINIKEVPFCLESNNKNSILALEKLAKTISENVYQINTKEREILHLAAVFANNFTNYMFHIANEITEENDLSFDILKPLIYETANKIKSLSPKNAQTGPAKRNDQKTIEKQLDLLQDSPKLKEIYLLMTELIIKSSNQIT